MKNTENQAIYVTKVEFYSIVTTLIIMISSLYYASTSDSERLSSVLKVILTLLMFLSLFATFKARRELARAGGFRNKMPADDKDGPVDG